MSCTYRPRCNSIWSVWYCLFVLGLHAYLLYLGIVRYRLYDDLRWTFKGGGKPTLFLFIYIILHGVVIGCVPFFIAFSLFKTGDIWSTELDFVYNSKSQLGRLLPMNRSVPGRPNHFRSGQYSVLDISPKLLPILANQKLFGITLDFLNYFVALIIYAMVYPSVLWTASKWFSMLFSSQLVLHAFTALYSYISFSLLFRIHVVGDTAYPDVPGRLRSRFILPNEYWVLGCYLTSLVAMYFASAVLYGYGYTRFCISWQQLTQNRERAEMRTVGGDKGILRPTQLPPRIGCCEGYCPHLVAIFLLLIMVGAKIVIIYDMMLITMEDWPKHLIALCCVALDVAYLFSWILLWLFLTCKRKWSFKVTYTVPEVLTLLQSDWAPGSAWSRYKKTVTDPQSAMVLISGEEVYVTDDVAKKQAIMRQAHKYGIGSPKEEVYWLRPTGSPETSSRARAGDKNSPQELKQLLSGNPNHPVVTPGAQPHPQAAGNDGNINHYASNKDTLLYQTYEAVRPPPGPQRSNPQPSTATMSAYRFNAEPVDQHQQQQNYEDQQRAHDIANTFGTLPRGEYKRRRLIQGSDADFQYNGGKGLMMGVVGSSREGSVDTHRNAAGVAYASIHKSRPSPTPSSLLGARNDYVRLAQQPDIDSMVSRGSSYANIPQNQRPPQGWPQQPQARVINVTYNHQYSNNQQPATNPGNVNLNTAMSSQQSTPKSSRASGGGFGGGMGGGQNTYATIGGTGGVSESLYGSPQSQRAVVINNSRGGVGQSQQQQQQMIMTNGGGRLGSFSDNSSQQSKDATLTRNNAAHIQQQWSQQQQQQQHGGLVAPASATPSTTSSAIINPLIYSSSTTNGSGGVGGIMALSSNGSGGSSSGGGGGGGGGMMAMLATTSGGGGGGDGGPNSDDGTGEINNFTPSSTLTSQGSYSHHNNMMAMMLTNNTPTPSTTVNNNINNINNNNHQQQQQQQLLLQQQPNTMPQAHHHARHQQKQSEQQLLTPMNGHHPQQQHQHRHLMPAVAGGPSPYDRNDSANFSLTSSNESENHHPNSQYATSIV